MFQFIERAEIAASAVSPIEIGLAHYQKQASPNTANCIRAFSILCSPLDSIIQVAVAAIWIIYDDLKSNSSILDWGFTLVRLPAKVLLGTVACIVTQFLENIQRVKDIYSCDSNELYHAYKGKWTWFTQNYKQPVQPVEIPAETPSQIQVNANIELGEEMRQKISNLVLSALKDKNYTHLYILEQGRERPPMLFEVVDGAFADKPMPNKGHSSFILLMINAWEGKTLLRREDCTVNHIKTWQKDTAQDMTDERTGFLYGLREYLNLRRYGLLPLKVIEKIQQLPAYTP